MFNWNDFGHDNSNKYLRSGIKNLVWTAIFAGTSLYFNKVSSDYKEDWNNYRIQNDRDNSRYYAIGRDVTAGCSAITLGMFSFDLYKFFAVRRFQERE